jgi:fused signal recognition particle receptor
VAINWFRKKKKSETDDGVEPDESPKVEVTEEVEDVDGTTDEPHVSEVSNVPEDPDRDEKSQQDLEEATADSENATEVEVQAGEDVGEEEKSGFFRGAWEATKKLALTPVDPFFENMVAGLERTRKNLLGQIASVFRLHKKVDEDFWEELEDTLITSDVGTAATDRIMDELREYAVEHKISEPAGLTSRIREVIEEILLTDEEKRTLNIEQGRVNVIMMVGVNGAGKTTSTAKLTHFFVNQGFSVMLAAADTFRAAAIEQLESWAKRLDVPLIKHKEGSDPAAVVYDACSAAKARKCDILLIDTAGRLQNKSNLMKELEKIHRVIGKEIPEAPHEVLLVLDATTGQNALSQAQQFSAVTPITGLVMCKLDGSAKGGIMVAVAQEFGIPVKFIGVGEAKDDLKPFVPKLFIEALFGESEFQKS